MKVGIYTNPSKDKDLSVTKRLVACLEKKGVDFSLEQSLSAGVEVKSYFSVDEKADLDFMITVGGDGTILRIAKYCATWGIPIAGLNLGYVGFLAESEPDNIEPFIVALLEKRYKLERRSLLMASVNDRSFLALNDAVLSRAYGAKMLVTDVYVNNEFVDSYFCDGFIVSTPTGSTAYSLSAGGPIVSPNVSAFVLTSINSHSLHSRPIVVSENDEIKLVPGKVGSFNLVVDGDTCLMLDDDSVVTVKKFDKEVNFVRLEGHSFYNKLLTKLNKWSVTSKED